MAIPKGTQLHDHLLDFYELKKEELKQKIKEAKLIFALICFISIINM